MLYPHRHTARRSSLVADVGHAARRDPTNERRQSCQGSWFRQFDSVFLVVALLVIGAAEPGALAQPGGGDDTGGGTVYFINGGGPTNWTWSMNSDGSNTTQLGWWGYLNVPSRDLHNGYRWYLTVLVHS